MQSTLSTRSVENGQISFRSRLMQNYRLALPVSGKSGLATCPTAGQDIELYSIGTNGAIYNIYRDPNSDTGWSATNLHFSYSSIIGDASLVTAQLNPDGSTRVWAVDSNNPNHIFYLDGLSAGSTDRWGQFAWQPLYASSPDEVRPLGLQILYDPSGHPYLVVNNISGMLNSAMILLSGEVFYPVSGHNTPRPPVFSYCAGLIEAWDGSGASPGVFASVQNAQAVITGIGSYFGGGKGVPGAQAYGMYSAISAAIGPHGYSEPFAISMLDQCLYYLATTAGSQQLAPVNLSGSVTVKALAAGCSPLGLEVFGLGSGGGLYHTRRDGSGATGWSGFLQIDTATYVQLVAAHHPAGYTEAFAVTSGGDLIQIWQDPETSEWHFDPVDIPVRMEVEQYASYQVSVFVYDGGGLPLVNQPVTLYCDTDLTVEVNGKTCFIDPLTHWPDTTNASGQLIVTLRTASLGVPQFRVTVDGLGVTALVDPSGPTQDCLANLTEEQLKAAHWTSDAGVQTPVIPSGTEDGTVAALVNTAKAAMGMVERTRQANPAAMRGRLHPRNDHRAVRFIENTDAAPAPIPPFRIADLAYQEAWQVSFLETGLSFRSLDPEQAELALARYRTLPKTADILGYDLDWGDVLQIVEDGLVTVQNFTINAVNGTISWSFDLLVNGLATTFEAIVEGAEQLVNLVELVFEKIAAAFDELFRWLGFIFNWGDIVRTHDQVKFVMNQTFQFSQRALVFVKEKIDEEFDGLSAQVQQVFDDLKNNPFINDSSLGGLGQTYQALAPGDMQDAMDNDVVRSAFIANAQNASSTGGRRLASPELVAVAENLIATLESYASEFHDANEAFQQALDYFRKAVEEPEQFLQNAIKGVLSLVEMLALAVLDTVRVVLDAILDAAAALLEAIWATLNETWDIPLISDLYESISGNELTMLDVIALLIAVPTTVLYKILRGAAPFPEGDQSSIDNFRNQFGLSRLLDGSGMGPAKTPIPQGGETLTSTALLSGPALLIYSIMGVASSTCVSYLVTYADASQIPQTPEFQLLTSSAVVLFELLDQGLNIPWLTDDINYDNTSDVLAITLWFYGFVGCAVDAVFLLKKNKLSRLDSPIVPVFFDSIAMALIGCQYGFSYKQPSDKLALAQNLFGSIPGVFAFLSVEELNTDPPKAGIIVLTGIDGLCALGTLVSGIVSVTGQAQSLDAA